MLVTGCVSYRCTDIMVYGVRVLVCVSVGVADGAQSALWLGTKDTLFLGCLTCSGGNC